MYDIFKSLTFVLEETLVMERKKFYYHCIIFAVVGLCVLPHATPEPQICSPVTALTGVETILSCKCADDTKTTSSPKEANASLPITFSTSWYFENVQIGRWSSDIIAIGEEMEDKVTVRPDEIVIFDAGPTDVGNYTCSWQSDDFHHDYTTWLNVQEPLLSIYEFVIDSNLPNTSVSEGTLLSINCSVNASEVPSELELVQASIVLTNVTNNTILSHKMILERSDNNLTLECCVRGNGGQTSCTADVIVPQIIFPPENISLESPFMPQSESTLLNFTCTGDSSNPPSHIVWQLNGTNVTANINETYLPGDHNAEYVISILEMHTTRAMNGQSLSCSLVYEQEVVAEEMLTLHITFPPENISLEYPSMPQSESTLLNFTCTGDSSNPPSHIMWQINGTNVTANINETHLPGDHNAEYVISILEMNTTRAMNGQNLTCSLIYEQEVVADETVTSNITFHPENLTLESPDMPKTENSSLSFACYGDSSNPTSYIMWDLEEINTTVRINETHLPGDYNADYAISVLEINATREMNGLGLSCSIVYQEEDVAIEPVTLDIKFHSDNITLESPGMPQKENTSLRFVCYGDSSNPASNITWQYEGEHITANINQTHLPGDYNADYVVSVLEVNATREMNGRHLNCSIQYELEDVANETATLNITFYSRNITLNGTAMSQEGDTTNFTCASGSSNPPAHIMWDLDGVNFTGNAFEEHLPGDYNADYVQSSLKMTAERCMNGQELKCTVMYEEKDILNAVSILDVAFWDKDIALEGPEMPQDGSNHTFTCVGGCSNPLSHILWHLNGVNITEDSKEEHSPGDYHAGCVHSSLNLSVVREINGQDLTCSVLYKGENVTETAVVGVAFYSDSIYLEGPELPLHKDTPYNFTCIGGSSNPPSHIQWRRDGTNITVNVDESHFPGDHNAYSVKSTVRLNLTENMDGQEMSCTLLYDGRGMSTESTVLYIDTVSPKIFPYMILVTTFFSVMGLIWLIVLIVVGIGVYRKRKSTGQSGDSDPAETTKQELEANDGNQYQIDNTKYLGDTCTEQSGNLYSEENEQIEMEEYAELSEATYVNVGTNVPGSLVDPNAANELYENTKTLDYQGTNPNEQHLYENTQQLGHSGCGPVYENLSAAPKENPRQQGGDYESTQFVQHQDNVPLYTFLRPVVKQGSNVEQRQQEDEDDDEECAYEAVQPCGFECSPKVVKLKKLINRGTLKEVYMAESSQLKVPGTKALVVKKSKGTSSFDALAMIKEINTMRAVGSHPHLVGLIAQCLSKGAPLCIMAYEGKNLRKHLQEHKFGDYSRPDSAHRRLLSHCLDVANGMNYLFQLKPKMLHKCLSADHILIGPSLVCKVIGYGIAENVLEKEIFARDKGSTDALAWKAPETISSRHHTQMSDVWTFGVLMWEMFTVGDTPRAGMTDTNIKKAAIDGEHLDRPHLADQEIYDLMIECWDLDQHKRPSFQELVCYFKNSQECS